MHFGYIQQFFFFGLLLATTGAFLWMLGSFLLPVFWAVVVAIVFYPLYQWLDKKLYHYHALASLATLLVVVFVVVAPIILVGGMVLQESLSLYQQLNNSGVGAEGFSILERASSLVSYFEPYGISQEMVSERLREWTATLSQQLASSAVTFSQVTFTFVVQTSLMLYILFFLLRDGDSLQKKLIHILPLGDTYERRLLERFSKTTRAVVKGTLVIAIIQGTLGGITFALTGVAAPVLWGVAMTILAIIPVLGTVLIWLPAGVILLLSGSFWAGFTILIVGSLLISLVDNILRPILVGRDTQMPDVLVLLATLGGLASFGVSGFVVGPIIAAFFLSLWKMFEERYHKELSANK